MKTKPSPWLTMEEAASRARVNVATLYLFRSQGRLHVGGTKPGLRGGKQLVHINHLDRQIALNWPQLDGVTPEAVMEPPPQALLCPFPIGTNVLTGPKVPLRLPVKKPPTIKH